MKKFYRNITSHFKFNKQERSGIFYLLALVFILQFSYYSIKGYSFGKEQAFFGPDLEAQQRLDSMQSTKRNRVLTRPFNPNFISDFKGYVLGMSPAEIDRLHRFRETGRFINSTEEFQRITQVSDSLVDSLSPYFKFPKLKARRVNIAADTKHATAIAIEQQLEVRKDLNKAKAEDLMHINGVGQVLSRRILKFREALGGFLSDEQLNDVYGLDRQVVQRILVKYTVVTRPEIQPISLREASAEDLSQLVYVSYALARRIVRYRDSVGEIKTLDELTKLQDFPTDRINRIKLYLTL